MLVLEGYGAYGKMKLPKIGKGTLKTLAAGAVVAGGAYAIGKAGGPAAAGGKLKSVTGAMVSKLTKGKTGMAAATDIVGRLPKATKGKIATIAPEVVATKEMSPIEPIVEVSKPAIPGWAIPAAIAAIGGFFMLRG